MERDHINIKSIISLLESPIQKLKLIGGMRSHEYKEHFGPLSSNVGNISKSPLMCKADMSTSEILTMHIHKMNSTGSNVILKSSIQKLKFIG